MSKSNTGEIQHIVKAACTCAVILTVVCEVLDRSRLLLHARTLLIHEEEVISCNDRDMHTHYRAQIKSQCLLKEELIFQFH